MQASTLPPPPPPLQEQSVKDHLQLFPGARWRGKSPVPVLHALGWKCVSVWSSTMVANQKSMWHSRDKFYQAFLSHNYPASKIVTAKESEREGLGTRLTITYTATANTSKGQPLYKGTKLLALYSQVPPPPPPPPPPHLSPYVSDMDELVKECFLAALKTLAGRKSEAGLFPLLTSTFYRSFMLESW